MIEYFDTYVRLKDGFIAVKGEIVCLCRIEHGRGDVAFYRNRNSHSRALAVCLGSNLRWCRERAVETMQRLTEETDACKEPMRDPNVTKSHS